jgi:hypothetical protein
MRVLLRLYREGKIEPEEAELPEMPRKPTRAQRALYELLKLRFGLQAADGRDDQPLMLARSEIVNEGIVTTSEGARYLLHTFEDWGVIHCVGEMPALGKGNGTRLFLPGPE